MAELEIMTDCTVQIDGAYAGRIEFTSLAAEMNGKTCYWDESFHFLEATIAHLKEELNSAECAIEEALLLLNQPHPDISKIIKTLEGA